MAWATRLLRFLTIPSLAHASCPAGYTSNGQTNTAWACCSTCPGNMCNSVCSCICTLSITPPEISSTMPRLDGAHNHPVSRTATVTIHGLNFGSSDPTPAARVYASGLCTTGSWTSATSVICNHAVSPSVDWSYSAALTVSGEVGTFTSAFTFDGMADLQNHRTSSSML